MTTFATLAEHVNELPLIDNHVHGYWLDSLDPRGFENALNEPNTEPLADFDSGFDTQLGFAIRAHCAPLLGLPPHSGPAEYWGARSACSEKELVRIFLPAAGVSDWLLDTGVPGVAGRDDMGAAGHGRVHEVVRIEQVAEQAAANSADYVGSFRDILSARTQSAVATKTVLAYRSGFDIDLSAPTDREVHAAAQRWRESGGIRLADPVLLRFGLHEALRLGKPLQIHVGLGDRDCDLHRTNPMHLIDLLRHSGDVPIILLHCYPYEREAGYLAAAFNNVHVDIGLSVNHLGARAAAFLGRAMELAPFRKILYSSDAVGPVELHYLGSRLWRAGMAEVLGGFVERGHWGLDDAMGVADLVGRGNAQRVYGL